MKNNFSSLLAGTELAVVPNPVNTKIYRCTDRPKFSDNFRILYLGWIVEEKGVYDIVDIVPDVLKLYPKSLFLFAGSKETLALQKIIENRGLTEHARVLGWVDGIDKQELLCTSRLLVLPSYTEGIPNVILEAMASGLPVITTPVGGIPSIFQNERNGSYITPGNKKELKNAIFQYFKDDEKCERVSRLTSEFARDKFDLEIIAERLRSIYINYV
jgi:glycosyltransferase involved in cell wall biosynthesis